MHFGKKSDYGICEYGKNLFILSEEDWISSRYWTRYICIEGNYFQYNKKHLQAQEWQTHWRMIAAGE